MQPHTLFWAGLAHLLLSPINGPIGRVCWSDNMAGTRVGALLLEADLIDSAQLRRALDHQQHRGGKTMGILVELGMLEHDQVYKFLARRGLPAINPLHCAVGRHVTNLLPRDFVMRHEVLPVDRLGRLLTVAMVYPFDIDAIAKAEELTGLRVKPMLCRAKEFHEAARRYYPGEFDACGARRTVADRGESDTAQRTLSRVRALTRAPITKHTRGRFSMLESTQGLTVERAAAILSRDPVALARVLAEANTREWTRRRPIVDRHEAIRRLGMAGVRAALESLDTWERPLHEADAVFTQWRSTAVAVAETAVGIAKVHAVAVPGISEAASLHNL
ncbi:MAG: HDOD domain-containing protein, partial [Candidatus Hydrogenedentes bacterium]|nr:HDOD domain-containing protein [Candidatus Hydrogenedentota bacterium]